MKVINNAYKVLRDENGTSLCSKYYKGEITAIEYFNELAKIKGFKNHAEK